VRGLRLLGHPLHPMLSAFPLALLSTSLLWELAGHVTGDAMWWRFAFWSIALGLVAATAVVGSGLWDYAAIPQGHPAETTATRHMSVMLAVVTCFACSLLWLRPTAAPVGGDAVWAMSCCALGFLGLLVGGWLGGELVFRFGLGGER